MGSLSGIFTGLIGGSIGDKFGTVNFGTKKAYSSSGQLIELQEEEGYFLIIHRDRFESEGIPSQTPVCGDFVGTIEALMEWITGHPHKGEKAE